MSEVPKPLPHAPAGFRRLSLRANFKWTFAANIVNTACQCGIVVVLGKLGGEKILGLFTLGFAITTPILAAATLQLRQVQVTDARNEYEFKHYFGTRIFTAVVALLIIVGVSLFGPYVGAAAWIIFWVGLGKGFEAISDIIRGLFQRFEQMDLSAISLMFKGPLGLAGLAGVYLLTRDIVWATAAMTAGGLLALLLYDLPQAARHARRYTTSAGTPVELRPNFEPGRVGRLIWRALPAGVGLFLSALTLSIPRATLERHYGIGQLGYYGAVAYIVDAAMLVVSALGQSASPRLATYFASDLPAFRRLLWKLLRLALVMGVAFVGGIALLGKPVLTLVYRPDFADYQVEFIILALSGALWFPMFFGGVALIATRNFYVQLVAGIATCGTTLLMSSVLIPGDLAHHGVRGAAYAALGGNAAVFICYFGGLWWLVTRRQRELRCSAPPPETVGALVTMQSLAVTPPCAAEVE